MGHIIVKISHNNLISFNQISFHIICEDVTVYSLFWNCYHIRSMIQKEVLPKTNHGFRIPKQIPQ